MCDYDIDECNCEDRWGPEGKPSERKPKFEKTYCSQCGKEFGPGDHGYSHCSDHKSDAKNEAACGASHSDAVLGVERTIWQEKHEIENARREKMREAMEEYDRTVYRPAMAKMRDRCSERGHKPGHWHYNGLGGSFLICASCGAVMEKDCA